MKTISLVVAAALSLTAFGCKKGGGSDCTKAIDHSMELSKAAMEKSGIDAKVLEKMKGIGLQHCTDDKWSEEVTKCMVDAKTEKDSGACYTKLSSDQQDKMNKAAMALMTASAAPTPAPAPATPPAAETGSAAGSAGSAAAPH
ncbi:MAG TPA: hypothetical protein VH143_21720 [Kofleriaceae bacterium]|nr:hypothetical protein [Kofleriaceae bacterium]